MFSATKINLHTRTQASSSGATSVGNCLGWSEGKDNFIKALFREVVLLHSRAGTGQRIRRS